MFLILKTFSPFTGSSTFNQQVFFPFLPPQEHQSTLIKTIQNKRKNSRNPCFKCIENGSK